MDPSFTLGKRSSLGTLFVITVSIFVHYGSISDFSRLFMRLDCHSFFFPKFPFNYPPSQLGSLKITCWHHEQCLYFVSRCEPHNSTVFEDEQCVGYWYGCQCVLPIVGRNHWLWNIASQLMYPQHIKSHLKPVSWMCLASTSCPTWVTSPSWESSMTTKVSNGTWVFVSEFYHCRISSCLKVILR